MPFKLSVKIFAAFLFVTIFSVVMMVGTIRYFADRNFEAYVQSREMETLANFADTMASFYTDNGGWAVLITRPGIWLELTESAGFEFYSAPPPSRKAIPGRRSDHKFAHPPPPHHLPPEVGLHGGPDTRNMPHPPPGPMREPVHRELPINLFDVNKELIAGQLRYFSELSTVPITVNNQIVGWLGLKFGPNLSHPLDREFMQKQSQVFYLIGGGILIVSTLIALLLTNHLLTPIQQLSAATRALTQRDFKTRIPVESSDELGNLAENFNNMAKRMEDYERHQQQWLSDISHELRTPLSVLIGEIEALQDGIRQPDTASLASLGDEAKHLGKIVNDLHELSMVEAGGLLMERQSLDPVSILDQTIRLFKNRYDGCGIKVETNLKSPSVLTVNGDPDRLMQLFSNLLENTFQHADKPCVLSVRQVCEENHFRVFFEDTGPGVSPEALPHLFERLYRADASRSRSTGGSGLGLAICKSIAENHQGKIQARNGEKGGLLIAVTLPIEGSV